MDDADPRLEGSTEPIYDPIRGKASSAVNPIAGYTKICTPSLMECVRLRVKDVDFGRGEIVVRSGKGGKDRRVPLPQKLREPLQAAIERACLLHASDIAAGLGEVWLPHALARKYPNAARETGWQYVFPSPRLSVDPRSGSQRR